MDGFRSAEALRTLLQLYEGVRIGRVRCHPSAHSSVLLQVTDPTTLVRLARCAENANVAFYVWSDSQGVAEEAPELPEIPMETAPEFTAPQFLQVKIFGIFFLFFDSNFPVYKVRHINLVSFDSF